MKLFELDGREYDVWVTELTRNFTVQDTDKAGRTTAGNMVRDIIGTYYNYTMTLDTSRLNVEEYGRFYDVISAPVDSHIITFPYNGETLTYEAYVSMGDDSFSKKSGSPEWSGLAVTFTAMRPQRRP